MKLLITSILFSFSFSLFSQCKGFEQKKDDFKGVNEITTLWIANSTKLKGNKLQYRVEKDDSKTVLIIKSVLAQKTSVPSTSEIYFINDKGDKLKFLVKEEYETTEIQTAYGKGHELKASFFVPDDLLEIWNSSFNRCRLYYGDESLTYEFNHAKNLKLFHNALNCYKEAYAKQNPKNNK